MTTDLLLAVLLLAVWTGLLALQLADIVITASRLPQLSAFTSVKAELLEMESTRANAERLAALREQIAELDARELARAIPPGRGATAQLWRATPWRLAPTALALIPLALTVGTWPLALAALPLPVVTYVLALAAARASVAAASARATVHEQHRAEIQELVDRVSRTARKRVAGLGERVNRALQILREQQS
ncbi:hypothetical protein M2152_000832 [Microbacteriaceae bacterium SG_E_30_P1]|uniref:Uncharacterized protein n=1 Tax=Antiquaquibacter oligotrophicus TaxID=2880260 RepID=A0ABT6KKY6_9MICO|nr:hypothetical protein [Antiquaquibacter oligotrophicus]MDH6180650.1 hypothetical protein [Antiquaquibacter oligotrophicus]UDF13622.1 hypothetical protein LH407_01855 [Antiquaquibacter oligotrophicus]